MERKIALEEKFAGSPEPRRCYPSELFTILANSFCGSYTDHMPIAIDFSGGYATSVISGVENRICWILSFAGVEDTFRYGT